MKSPLNLSKLALGVVIFGLALGPALSEAQVLNRISGARAATSNTYSYQYELKGNCIKVTVTKSMTYPRTRIRSDGYNVRCQDISTSARALQRSVELKY